MSVLYGNGMDLSERVLDLLWGRQNLTLNNIANVDTPDFKSQYLSFEEVLGKRLRDASAGGRPMTSVNNVIHSTNAVVHTTQGETTRLDGNNVDMDQEQTDLVRTAYEYQYVLSSINSEISRLRSAAKTF